LTTHVNPDGDAIGSQMSLASFLISLGKHVRIVNQDPVPRVLEFIVHAGVPVELYAPTRHDAALRECERIVLVDNSAPDRLGRMERIMVASADHTLCIDHHPMREAPWTDVIVDVEASATTAMIYELTQACGWEPDTDAARAMYVGLVTDTGFFRFNSTRARTHDVAAGLMRLGVEPARVYEEIYERNSVAYTRLLGHALTGLRLDSGGAIASVKISGQLIDSIQAENVDTSEITTALLAMDGVRVAVLFRELADGRIKVSLRSKGDLDVHMLATEFGGGGHRNASGIVMGGGLDQVMRTITKRVTALLERAGTEA
jgi:phosphoesterase RecJ-like protein